MFLGIFSQLLQDSNKRHLGPILLLEFILFDVLRIFFVFQSGTGMLNCLPPFYSVSNVEHLLKNCMKAFLSTWIGVPFLKYCAEENPSDKTYDVKNESENNNGRIDEENEVKAKYTSGFGQVNFSLESEE